MSTIRATFVQHGSSAVPNITLNASGQVIVASGIVSSGTFAAPSGSVSAPGIYFNGDSNTGLYSPAADTIAFTEGGVEALRIDSSGRVGIGTSSPSSLLHLGAASGAVQMQFNNGGTSSYLGHDPAVPGFDIASKDATTFRNFNGALFAETMRITAAGRVGIGTTTPGTILDVVGPGNPTLTVRGSDGAYTGIVNIQAAGGGVSSINATGGGNALKIETNSVERCRVDSSGRLLVGTSSARSNFFNTSTVSAAFQLEGIGSNRRAAIIGDDFEGALILASQKSGAVGGNQVLANNDPVGAITFQGNDGSEFVETASITAYVDGTPGANDMPGRLVFSTTADGASSPTERMRIGQSGYTKFSINGSYEGGNIHEFNGGENTGACLVVRWTPSGLNSGNGFIVKTPNTAAATTHNFIAADTSAGNVFRVRADGNVYNTNGVYGSISDVKLKENIVDASSQWSDIKALRVRKYNFKEGLTHTQIGVIAQEVEQVSPGLVYETPDRDVDGNETGEVTKGINYSVLYMKAVKALQEAMERIEQLETSNADLLTRVTALESA